MIKILAEKLNIKTQITRPQVDLTIEEEVTITVDIDGELKKLKLKKSYKLKRVREELETNKFIEIRDEKIVFIERGGEIITIKSEENRRCADILDEEEKKIFLKRLDWRILVNIFNLGNGRTFTYEGTDEANRSIIAYDETDVASRRALIIEDCKLLLSDGFLTDRKLGNVRLTIIKATPTEEFKTAIKNNLVCINNLETIKDDFGCFIPNIVEFYGDFRKWEICFQKPFKSIFHYLDEDLQTYIKKLSGKKIVYAGEQKLQRIYNDHSRNLLLMLPIPREISKNFHKDCQIFATVSNIEDSDIFTFRLFAANTYYGIAIHCIQLNQRNEPKNYHILIRWIVVGYDLDFNYSASDFNFRLQSFKIEFNQNNILKSINNHTFEIYEWKLSESIKYDFLLGVPVFRILRKSYDSLVIGNHFCRYNDRINTYIYGYDLGEAKYSTCKTLPNFEFNFLYFLDPPYDAIFNKFPIMHSSNNISEEIQKIGINPNSKFANLYSSDEAPNFIGQIKEEFIMEHLRCGCEGRECEISGHFSKNATYEAEYFSPSITYEVHKNNYLIC
ncbi:15651_t:CDS:1 [Dentiscutata heterogama]|uniref:15651_t:CDS:1 n=1 Tax=Dentiscutata heterogama TaxID=1316150 RepID=A0ACA9LIY8_9GLOM|nr:15651_t:CDS:1 [Dentiscutata heterogama]